MSEAILVALITGGLSLVGVVVTTEHLDLFAAYGIDYVYVGDYEQTTCRADIEALSRLFETVYDNGAYIFRVPQKSDS